MPPPEHDLQLPAFPQELYPKSTCAFSGLSIQPMPSQTSEEGQAIPSRRPVARLIFHAPVKGATSSPSSTCSSVTSFQSTHPRRVRRSRSNRARTSATDFNPRTREGCDRRLQPTKALVERDFNPRTREGCDRACGPGAASCRDFNPRTREGCDTSAS